MGSLAAIALLAFEPFTQAILSFDNRAIILTPGQYTDLSRSNNESLSPFPSIGQSIRLNAGTWTGFGGGDNSKGLFTFPGPNNTTSWYSSYLFSSMIQDDMGMKAALWNGFSPLTTAQTLKPASTCVSGNCSWTNFASIAVCHKCQDISQFVVKSSGRSKNPGVNLPNPKWGPGMIPDISNNWPGPNFYQSEMVITHTKYKIPSLNLSLSNYNGKSRCNSTSDTCPDTYLSLRVTTNPGQTLNFKDLNTMIMAFQYLNANESWRWYENETVWEKTSISSQECALFFCVNEYEDVLSQGVLNEKVISSWTNKTTGSYSADGNNITEYFNYANFSLDMGYALVNLSDLQIRIPDGYGQKSNLSTRSFNITQTTIVSLLNVLNDGFWGYDITQDYPSLLPLRWIYPARGLNKPLPFVAGLGESSHIPTTIGNVASSLTKWIRDNTLQASPNRGSATSMVIIIRVQWFFFIFPIITFCAGMIFAVLSIWEIQRLGRPALKDSIISTLACAPGDDNNLRARLKEAVATGKSQELGREVLMIWDEDEGIGQLKERKTLI